MYRNGILKECVLRRITVILKANEGSFSGVITKYNHETVVFEQCQSVPTKEGETTVPFKGRTIIDRENISYLVDVS